MLHKISAKCVVALAEIFNYTIMENIEGAKTYTGSDLDNVIFRPILEKLGIKVLWNMPIPNKLHFWKRNGYTADKYTKVLGLEKTKYEMSYQADDYFSMVYEIISRKYDVSDLLGTELEETETTLLKDTLIEKINTDIWNGENAIISKVKADSDVNRCSIEQESIADTFKAVWDNASSELKEMKSEGKLAFYVSKDIYRQYDEYLCSVFADAGLPNETICYKGIPLVRIDTDETFILLADSRNIAYSVNTADFPGCEARLWYNPHLMQNRQRVVFMSGADYLLPELISFAYKE